MSESDAERTKLLRIIDANLNRAREALRVMEEYARFALEDAGLSSAIKETRHALAQHVNGLEASRGSSGRKSGIRPSSDSGSIPHSALPDPLVHFR